MTLPLPHSDGPLPDDERITVLVVEDEVFIRINIADYLRECGFRVIEATTADEGKSILESDQTVHVVFSDVQTPGEIDGFGLARWIRDHRPDLHIILNSGMTNAAKKAADLCEKGPLLAKPYNEADVVARIQSMLRRNRQKEL